MKFPNKYSVNYGLKLLKIDVDDQYKETVLNEISSYLFDTSKTEQNGKRVFDFNFDYEYYWVDFLEKRIDLNKQDISWWEFDKILGSILLDENSTISKVIKYRTYKKPTKNIKLAENEEHKFYLEKQRQYALPLEKDDISKIENNIRLMMSRAKEKSQI